MKRNPMILAAVLAGALSTAAFAAPTEAAAQTADGKAVQTIDRSFGVGGRYDADLQKSVEKTLGDHKEFKEVKATVDDGQITLTGSVKLLADKLSLEKKMHDKDHVSGLLDQVEVADANLSDAALQEKLAKKLRYDRVGQGSVFNSLDLAVNGGAVTLSGSTHDPISRESAVSIIEHTPGVKSLMQQVKVEPVSFMDDELRRRLARSIYRDPVLSQFAIDPQAPIRIAVDHGNVTLSGVVDTTMQKTVATIRAKEVPGVFSVTDNIKVEGQQSR